MFTNRSPDSRPGFLSSTETGFCDLLKTLKKNFLASVRSFHPLLDKLILHTFSDAVIRGD